MEKKRSLFKKTGIFELETPKIYLYQILIYNYFNLLCDKNKHIWVQVQAMFASKYKVVRRLFNLIWHIK